MSEQVSGTARIGHERYRQYTDEGYTHEGDVGRSQELLAAAHCYLTHAMALENDGVDLVLGEFPEPWPWAPEFFKPGPISERTLEKAGALIAAAIDAMTQERKNDD